MCVLVLQKALSARVASRGQQRGCTPRCSLFTVCYLFQWSMMTFALRCVVQSTGSPRGGYPAEPIGDGEFCAGAFLSAHTAPRAHADDDSDPEDVDGDEHGEHDDDRDQPRPQHARNSSASAAPVVSGKPPAAPKPASGIA